MAARLAARHRAKPDDPVANLKGVGPKLAEQLASLGIHTLGDLWLHLPTRYQDRSRIVPLRSLKPGEHCLIQGQVVDSQLSFGRRRSWTLRLTDRTGFITLRFFHFANRQRMAVQNGMVLTAFGEVRFGPTGLEMAHPEYEAGDPVLEEALTPIYPTTRGLGQKRLRQLTRALAAVSFEPGSGWPLERLRQLHWPPADTDQDTLVRWQQDIARDELTAYYLIMRHRQSTRAEERTLALPQAQQLGRLLLQHLGFRLTDAQRRATTEVLNDLARETPMLRLVQGDVGSGKTVVAAFAAIRAAEHGGQTALMAPTEILAEQHYLNFSNWLAPLGIRVVLLTGRQSARERRERQQAIASGEALVAIGTHALFQSGVDFYRLALTIVDEQHRFGVHQRMALRDKGRLPHQLVMTATPIPRTLTMALYADMDVSLIDELPPGRQPISTRLISDARRAEVIDAVRRVVAGGQQAYWVCTLIEPNETLPASAAEEVLPELAGALPEARIGLLHGRLDGDAKGLVMTAFKDGAIDLLVATTVVEVGVDVPNATLMVIEDADRLGLAQLHQLRGRVGRGRLASHCLLLYRRPLSKLGRARLEVIRDSQDGFYIAEQDLALRGPGELLGARQTGEAQFRIADLGRDAGLIPEVIERGDRLLREDPAGARALLRAWAPADRGHISV